MKSENIFKTRVPSLVFVITNTKKTYSEGEISMKRSKRFLGLAVGAMMLLSSGAFAACNVVNDAKDSNKDVDSVQQGDYDKTDAVELIIDGGGQNAAYNTTESLIYDKYTNPYPYNTLEKLAEEWNRAHTEETGFYFTVAKSSIDNNRETMLPMLQKGTAPDLIYYLPTTITEDQNKGYFYDLTDALKQPNVYSAAGEAGSEKWSDIWSSEEFSSEVAPNGQRFTVALEWNPIGFLYNKTLLKAAGVTEEPETFKEFMEAQDAINAYAKTVNRADPTDDSDYICPYFYIYPWYNSYLESTLRASDLDVLDVINPNGMVDAEEFARGYMLKDENGERLYSPDDETAVELYRLVREKSKYFPANYTSYYAEQQFAAGNLVMLEVTGGNIRELIDQVDGDFEVGVFPYPYVETQPENAEESSYYTTVETEGKYVRRGMSGYCTGYAITKSAFDSSCDYYKGDGAKEACIDMLMWLSCYKNNDRMINDLGFAIPLSGSTTYEYFEKLSSVYETDRASEDTIAWSAVTAGANVNKSYYDACYLFNQTAISAADLDEVKEKLTSVLMNSFKNTISNLYNMNKWDQTKWPPAGTTNS